MTAFNIDEAFLPAFTMPKGRSQGSGATFEIKYVDAALDADAFAAESTISHSLLHVSSLPRRSTQVRYIYLHSSSIRHNGHILLDISESETLTPSNPQVSRTRIARENL